MHSGKLNWTELNWTGSFSSVQFSFLLCIEPATSCDHRRRRTFLTVKNVRRPSPVVAGSVHSGRLNWTELNDPVQFSSVQFSSVQSSSVQFSFTLCIGLNRRAFVDNMSNSDIQLILIIIIIIFFIINWVISNNRVQVEHKMAGNQKS